MRARPLSGMSRRYRCISRWWLDRAALLDSGACEAPEGQPRNDPAGGVARPSAVSAGRLRAAVSGERGQGVSGAPRQGVSVSIRRRGKRSYQVRVAPFPAKTLPTRDAAERYELELQLRRAQGDRYVEKPV